MFSVDIDLIVAGSDATSCSAAIVPIPVSSKDTHFTVVEACSAEKNWSHSRRLLYPAIATFPELLSPKIGLPANEILSRQAEEDDEGDDVAAVASVAA